MPGEPGTEGMFALTRGEHDPLFSRFISAPASGRERSQVGVESWESRRPICHLARLVAELYRPKIPNTRLAIFPVSCHGRLL